MTYHVNIHMPANVAKIDDLSVGQFVAKTKTDGALKTIDVYYRTTSEPKTKQEKFLQKLETFAQRLRGFKPAIQSNSLTSAFKNIHQQSSQLGKNFNINLIPTLMKQVVDSDNKEISSRGTTVHVFGWTDAHDLSRMVDNLQ